jgi:L-alanine-DL-glutamate epimerase-like enolase superfamily enzyme
VQPDVSRAGGLTESKRIGELAQDRGVLCIPHSFKTNIGLAASLALSAALPNSPYCEYPQSESPLKTGLTKEKFPLNGDGTVELSDAPGLGVTLDEDVVEKYRYVDDDDEKARRRR